MPRTEVVKVGPFNWYAFEVKDNGSTSNRFWGLTAGHAMRRLIRSWR